MTNFKSEFKKAYRNERIERVLFFNPGGSGRYKGDWEKTEGGSVIMHIKACFCLMNRIVEDKYPIDYRKPIDRRRR